MKKIFLVIVILGSIISKNAFNVNAMYVDSTYIIDGGDDYQVEYIGCSNRTITSYQVPKSRNYILLADIQTFDPDYGDPAGVRILDYTPNGIDIKIEEEQSKDTETTHYNIELIGLLRIKHDGENPTYIKDKYDNIIGETHSIDYEMDRHNDWGYLAFGKEYKHAIVFGTVVSQNDEDPCHVRIKNVADIGCNFRIEEWAYGRNEMENGVVDNGKHGRERLHFVILEKGKYSMYQEGVDSKRNSVIWEVGDFLSHEKDYSDACMGFATCVAFKKDNSYPFIFTRSQTCNDGMPIVVRNEPLTEDSWFRGYKRGTNIRIQEEEAHNQYHQEERIGYLVVGEIHHGSECNSRVVRDNEALQVIDNHLCNSNGYPIQLRGMSAFWTNWEDGRKFMNDGVIAWLIKDWDISVYRIPVGVRPKDPKGSGKLLKDMNDESTKGPGLLDMEPDDFEEYLVDILAAVQSCIDRGIYVILDWHVHDALHDNDEDTAVRLFKSFINMIKNNNNGRVPPNVIFEIWNEPGWIDHKKFSDGHSPNEEGPDKYNQTYSWSAIKGYSYKIISAIRDLGVNNVIICPTPIWDQDINMASIQPITGFDNIIYSFHFYAGSHTINTDSDLNNHTPLWHMLYETVGNEWGINPATGEKWTWTQAKLDAYIYLTAGGITTPIPTEEGTELEWQWNFAPYNNLKHFLNAKKEAVFVSEWGTCTYDGGSIDSSIFKEPAYEWLDILDYYDISWCCWSISDKNEAASALKEDACRYGSWCTYDLTENGKFLRDILRNRY